jgi:hypothetical protein
MLAPVAGSSSSGEFEMGCERFHPTRCSWSLHANSVPNMVEAAMTHGALVHGFTPVFYSRERQAGMAAEAARHVGN